MTAAAIVLAGGVGSRMRPLTDDCPKPLLPLGAEPLLAYQLRRLVRAGVRDAVLATGYLAGAFQERIGDGARWGLRVRHSVETTPLGTGGALRAAAGLLPDCDRVVVINGDLLSSHDLNAQLLAAAGADLCLHVRQVPDVASYGQVTCDGDGRVTAFAEKAGAGAGLANAGTYVVRADVLRSLPRGRSSWEREAVPALIDGGRRVLAWRGSGYFRDVGDPVAYRQACVDAVTGTLPDAARAAATAYVDGRATVARDARLGAGTSVQAGARVGAAAWLDESVVLPDARVGAGACLVRCVVTAGTTVPAGSTHRDAVL